jgi:hypothetical protein
VDDVRVPDEPTEVELDAIRSHAAALSLPLMKYDIASLAISMRHMAEAVEPMLSMSHALAPDPTLFDPRR